MINPSLVRVLGFIKNYASLNFNDRKRAFDILLFAYVGVILFSLLSVSAFLKAELMLASALVVFDLGCFAFIMMLRHRGFRSHQSYYFVVFGFIAFFYLLISGGHLNTGYLWSLVFCPLMYTFLGHKSGLLANLLLVIGSAVYLFVIPENYHFSSYPAEVEVRFILVLACLSVLLFIQEFSRFESDRQYRALSSSLERKAQLDPLTQALNRRGMTTRLNDFELQSSLNDAEGALLIVDIDYFKRVNDDFGHAVGDQILKMVAECFRRNIRRDDSLCRWGGEEFLILLDNVPNSSAKLVAEKLRLSIEDCADMEQLINRPLTVSMGLAFWNEVINVDLWIETADRRLYQAKDQGRNRVVNKDEL